MTDLVEHGIPRACAVALAAVLCAVLPARGADTSPRNTLTQRKEAYKLVTQFRRVKTPEERRELVPRILAFGRTGASQLYQHLRYDTDRRLRKYAHDLARFSRSGSRKSRTVGVEIKKLRIQVTKLRSQKELTKEAIRKEGDPAVERLKKLLIPTMDKLDTMAAPLKEQRELLHELYAYRTECETALKMKAVDHLARMEAIEKGAIMAPLKQHKDLAAVEKANAAVARKLDPLEVQGIRDLNLLRFVLGLPLLRIDVKLCEAARDHSKDMCTKKFFSHTSPVAGKKTPWDRAKRAGTQARAENIFAGAPDPVRANQGWFHSPGHHKNMLNPAFTYVGLGRHERHWTQMFR
jgi:hypothetical protein